MLKFSSPVHAGLLAGGIFLMQGALAPAPAQKLEATDQALLRLDRPAGAQVGARLEVGMREFKFADDLLKVDLTHVLARAGGNPLPFLNCWGEAGWVRAEMDPDETGEGGLEWALGADAKLVEWVLDASPVIDRKETFALELGASYRSLESNFEDNDLSWGEVRVGPSINYVRRHTGEVRRYYEPLAVAARLGLAYVNADGEYGAEDLSENRDFALTLGFDLLGGSGWVTRFGVAFLGADEREFTLGAFYNF